MERVFLLHREGPVYTCSACGIQIAESNALMDYWIGRYEFHDAFNVIINDDNLVNYGFIDDWGYDVSCINCLANLGSREAGNVDDPPNTTLLFRFEHGRVVPPPQPENLQPPANPVHQIMCKSKQSFRTFLLRMAGSPKQTPSKMNCSVAAPIHKLPNELLERILSFLPFKLAIRTSVLSHKWKDLWRGSPSLCIIYSGRDKWAGRATESVRGLTTAKLTTFHLMVDKVPKRPNDVYEWEGAAKDLKPDNITIRFFGKDHEIRFWDDFYVNDSVKRLTLQLEHPDMLPRNYWPVSWPSLTSLSLCCQYLPQEVFDNILIGCPVLENLTIYRCAEQLWEFDLSKAPTVRSLDLHFNYVRSQPEMVKIDAPKIRYLRLYIDSPCELVDIQNLEEARVDGYLGRWVTKDSHLDMMQKLQNVKKLTFGSDFLMILSVAQLGDAPCPTFKVENLTVETEIMRSNFPGIRRLLQKSPALKKLTIDMVKLLEGKAHADDYWSSQGLYFDQRWESNKGVYFLAGKDGEPELVLSVIQFLLRNAISLETLVVRVGRYIAESEFQKLSTMIPQKMGNNVTVVFKKSFVRSFTSIFGGMACSEHGTDASMMI